MFNLARKLLKHSTAASDMKSGEIIGENIKITQHHESKLNWIKKISATVIKSAQRVGETDVLVRNANLNN